jgi:tRNA G26 N,N-dimethylase Trm1
MHPTNVIERAFELARLSRTIDEVRSALKSEGYSNVDAHLAGRAIKADLKKHFVG